MSIVRHMALFVIVCYVVIYSYILLVQVLVKVMITERFSITVVPFNGVTDVIVD